MLMDQRARDPGDPMEQKLEGSRLKNLQAAEPVVLVKLSPDWVRPTHTGRQSPWPEALRFQCEAHPKPPPRWTRHIKHHIPIGVCLNQPHPPSPHPKVYTKCVSPYPLTHPHSSHRKPQQRGRGSVSVPITDQTVQKLQDLGSGVAC